MNGAEIQDLLRFLQTPSGQVAALVVTLTLTYLFVIKLIRVTIPATDAARDEVEPDEYADVPAAGVVSDAADDDVVPEYYRPATEGVTPTEKEVAAAAWTAPLPPVRAVIESLRVGDVRFGVGDVATRALQAFPCGSGRATPLIERGAGDRAWHVTRFYDAGDDALTLEFERNAADEPLRVTSIKLETGADRR